jgi:superoxide dismutase, Fe-Mn family
MNPLSRRQLIYNIIGAATVASLPSFAAAAEPSVIPVTKLPPGTVPAAGGAAAAAPTGPFTLPPLPYAYGALEPHIDTETMKVHHDKHHGGYVAKLNAAVVEQPAFLGKKIEEILAVEAPDKLPAAIRNNGGGHYNHSLFWQILSPAVSASEGKLREPMGLNEKIVSTFGSREKFQDEFTKAATSLFGSGWVWLSVDGQKKLQIESTPNQDNPLMMGRKPVFGLDVWEHAYYLKHENRRPEYIEAFWKMLNWDFIASRYNTLIS